MSAREKAARVLDEHYDGDRGPDVGASVVQVLRDHGLAVVHAADHAGRDIALDRVETALRAAVTAQRNDQAPDHAQFYLWGWLLTVLAKQTEDVARVLAEQAGDYGHTHQLRDDAGMPPGDRIDRVVDALDEMVGYAQLLRAAAARYHSEVGHIAVETTAFDLVDRDGDRWVEDEPGSDQWRCVTDRPGPRRRRRDALERQFGPMRETPRAANTEGGEQS